MHDWSLLFLLNWKAVSCIDTSQDCPDSMMPWGVCHAPAWCRRHPSPRGLEQCCCHCCGQLLQPHVGKKRSLQHTLFSLGDVPVMDVEWFPSRSLISSARVHMTHPMDGSYTQVHPKYISAKSMRQNKMQASFSSRQNINQTRSRHNQLHFLQKHFFQQLWQSYWQQ